MIYAPVVIPTLCRYEHFKKCLESLSKNVLAKETDVYIGLDYPAKPEHWEGYKKINDFLDGQFPFKKLIVTKRERNFGATGNYYDMINKVFGQYDIAIISEDDNEFSPNFLEYINIGLEKYKSDFSIYAICGYSYPLEYKHKNNNIMKLNCFYSTWGSGVWKEKFYSMRESHKNQRSKIPSPLAMITYLKKYPLTACWMVEFLWRPRKRVEDVHIWIYMMLNKISVISPIISKVRNLGNDGSGQTGWKDETFAKQEIDVEEHFSFEGDENAYSEENTILVRDYTDKWFPNYTNKKRLLKICIKYFLMKFFKIYGKT